MKFLKFVRNAFQNAQSQSGDSLTTAQNQSGNVLTTKRLTTALQQQQQQQPNETENKTQNKNEEAMDESVNTVNLTNNKAPEIMEEVQENNKAEIPNDHDLFHKETCIAENDLFEVCIVKAYFKRQKLFSIEDHKYVLHFKKKTNNPILLKTMNNILEKAFMVILLNLKSYYATNTENCVYMTICQKNLVNPIRSSVYGLQTDETKDMVDHIMSDFNRFINSNETLAFDESSLEVYFKVLSEVNIKYSKHRRKAVPIRCQYYKYV